jgi:triosephosphate isomerase
LGKIVAGNWKMNGSAAMTEQLLSHLRASLPGDFTQSGGTVIVCPPFPYLPQAQRLLAESPIALGAQDVAPAASGAFTGEVSTAMLKEFGVVWCLVGHSERRHIIGESDSMVRRKLDLLIEADLRPILCVGETLMEREARRQEPVVAQQLAAALVGIPARALEEMCVAYEPVWAIGTGHTATPQQAGEMHAYIRGWLRQHVSESAARELPILYGGSVTPSNAGDLLRQPDVDGVLVGGASLKADQFLGIIEHASN